MKGRESGMPDEAYWTSFFQTEGILDRLLVTQGGCYNLVEFGCGYGTFCLPAAKRTRGTVTALDIELEMVKLVDERAKADGLLNVRAEVRDFVEHGSGVSDGSQGHAMVFNLLHLEDPLTLLREANRVLQPGGILSVIHWRSDIETPRGPPLAIRPKPEQCATWLSAAGFDSVVQVDLGPAAPYHFGILAQRPTG
ncbi:MAG: class I SAM-dependent methyltransferase [Dechloromonas sp.]|uniref:class I SAM-dependent methyltransferase n=1 Tax=Dechloromonas sp. TaxID=1917218 RepID=UPI0027EA425B|nr:class I SAM-dependent methyltransferase [Dechloromonas sp.]MBT9520887.1 class I SAM-dependent methyltransferase [Dechloromonas sp.]